MDSSQASTISLSPPPSSHSWLWNLNYGRPYHLSVPQSSSSSVPPKNLPNLSKEIIILIINYTDRETALSCARLCRTLAVVARRRLLEHVYLQYKSLEYGEATQTNKLLATLHRYPGASRCIESIEIFDSPGQLPAVLKRDFLQEDDEKFEPEVIRALNDLCPVEFFHDEPIRHILRMATHLRTLTITISNYELDWQRYEEFHAARVPSPILSWHNLTSLTLRGVNKLPLSEIEQMKRLQFLSLSCSQLEAPEVADPASDDFEDERVVESHIISSDKVYLQEINLKSLLDNRDHNRGLAHRLKHGCLLSVDKLKILKIDIVTLEDIDAAAAIMDACGSSLEEIEFSTHNIKHRKDSDSPRASFDRLQLRKLKNLRSMILRLNFREVGEVSEFDWFLDNMEYFEDDNQLKILKVTIDMAHDSFHDGQDRMDLLKGMDWQWWDAIFMQDKFADLYKMTIVVSSRLREYEDADGIWLSARQCVLLEALEKRPGFELLVGEKWDYFPQLRHPDSSFCLGD